MPLAVGWTLAILVMAAFFAAGQWQLQRMHQKRAMLAAVSQALEDRKPVPLSAAIDPARARDYDWASGIARFAASPPMLLDNQLRNGRAGVRVYRIAYPDQGEELLVDMGWLPLDGSRRMPTSAELGGEFMGRRIELSGLLAAPPVSGLKLGPVMSRQDHVWLVNRIDMEAIEEAEGDPNLVLGPRVLKLDPDLPIGYERDLDILPNTLPPERHLGYAVQWFGLAAAVLAIAVLMTLRQRRRRPGAHDKMKP